MTRIAFLGPRGTFTEQALLDFGVEDVEPEPSLTIGDVFSAVTRGQAEFGVVPIENSVEGSVPATLDALAFDHSLSIVRETVIDIHHALIAAPGISLTDATGIASHPHATAQCRRWLSERMPGVPIEAANSTADAVRRAVEQPGLVAVGTRLAAEMYGGVVLAEAIEDFADNQTRFVMVGRSGIAPRTGDDKTSLALFMHADRPGALHMILSEFAYGEINLTKIQSRPTKRVLGEYMFFMDCEGHAEDPHIALALSCLRLKLRDVKVLGSYPRAR